MSSQSSQKKHLLMGLGMLAVFVVVLVAIFLPLFTGKDGAKVNGLDYLDNLYNSISKGSAYYIPDLKEAGKPFAGKEISLDVNLSSPEEAQRAALLFQGAGAKAAINGKDIKLSGDFGAIMASCLKDADAMFNNQGDVLAGRYSGQDAKTMLYTWWAALKGLEKSLNRQNAFDKAKYLKTVEKKAVEMSYNYFGIEPQGIGDKWGIVVFSLLFYVVYTLWYGYGVMYLFEGVGYQLEDH